MNTKLRIFGVLIVALFAAPPAGLSDAHGDTRCIKDGVRLLPCIVTSEPVSEESGDVFATITPGLDTFRGSYDIRSIPDLSVRQGETLRLEIDAAAVDRRYGGAAGTRIQLPQSIPGLQSASVEQRPDGQATLTLSIRSDWNDPITVPLTLVATEGRPRPASFVQPFGYEPLTYSFLLIPEPPDEGSIFDENPTVRPNEDDYLTIVRETAQSGRSNVYITGKTVRLKDGRVNNHPFNLEAIRTQIGELIIKADRVFVEDYWHLPGADVEIRARELYLATEGPGGETESDDWFALGWIDVTPRDDNIVSPTREQPDGARGGDAGGIRVYAGSVIPDAAGVLDEDVLPRRFHLAGGAGQDPFPGEDGEPGRRVPVFTNSSWPEEWRGRAYYVEDRTWNCSCSHCLANLCSSFCQPRVQNVTVRTLGDQNRPPTSGKHAIASGRGGDGGNGGSFEASVPLTVASVSVEGGRGGFCGLPRQGGPAGTPSPGYDIRAQAWCPAVGVFAPEPTPWVVNAVARPIAGQSQPGGGCGFAGENGVFVINAAPFAWLDPAIVRAVLAYASDAYIARHVAETPKRLQPYIDTLTAFQTDPAWEDVPPDTQLEYLGLLAQMQQLSGQAQSGLDFFGRPPGWVPALSFELLYANYEQEIDRSLRQFALAYALRSQNEATELKTANLQTQIQLLQQRIADSRREYGRKEGRLQEVVRELARVGARSDALMASLQSREEVLLARAQQQIANENRRREREAKIRGVARLTGTLLQTLPIPGQPAWAALGAGIQVVSDFNPDRPWDTLVDLSRIDINNAYQSDAFANFQNRYRQAVNVLENTNYGSRDSIQQARDQVAELIGPDVKYAENLIRLARGSAVDQGEVAQRLAQLKAEMPEFSEGIDEASRLLQTKADLHQELTRLMAESGEIVVGIQRDLAAIAAFSINLADASLEDLGRLQSVAQEIEQSARNRLAKYYYYLVKAYEYRFLTEYRTDFRLLDLYDELTKTNGQNVEHEALKAAFEGPLIQMTEQLIDRYLRAEEAGFTPGVYRLTLAERQTLAQQGKLNLDPIALGLVSLDREDLRLVGVEVVSAKLSTTASQGAVSPSVSIGISHPQTGRIARNGNIYTFTNTASRTGTQNTLGPFSWGVNYDFSTGAMTSKRRTEAVESVFSVLGKIDPSTTQIWSSPPLWTNYLLSWEWNTELHRDESIEIEELVLEFKYEYQRGSTARYVLVAPERDVMPVLVVSQADNNDRQNGAGSFVRAFDDGDVVEITAPRTFGERVFVGWVDGLSGQPLADTETLTLSMSQSRFIQPMFAPASVIPDPDEPANTYSVMALVEGAGGTVNPASQEVVEQERAELEVVLSSGYALGAVDGCGGGGEWVSDRIWRTGPIVAECTVRFQFQAVPDPEPPVIDNGVAYCAIGCEERASENGVRTVVFEADDPETGSRVRLEAVMPNAEGDPLRHRVYRTLSDGTESLTEAVSDLAGSTVTLERDARGRPQILTQAVLASGVIFEALARADASAEHRVVTPDGETIGGTNLPGAFTRFTAEGRVETYLEFVHGQDRSRAVVSTEADGKGSTRFERWDDLAGEWAAQSVTIDPISAFEAGHRVQIEPTNRDGLRFDIQTRVDRDLYF